MAVRPKTAFKTRDLDTLPSTEDTKPCTSVPREAPPNPTSCENSLPIKELSGNRKSRKKKSKLLSDKIPPQPTSHHSSSPPPVNDQNNAIMKSNSLQSDAIVNQHGVSGTDDSLTDLLNSARKGIHLVHDSKIRSQQLTFESFISSGKLEVCSKGGEQIPPGIDPTAAVPNETVEHMESALKGLGKLEGEVMSALFPTDGTIPQSYELIASRFGMTLEEVKGIADNALRGLRGTRGTRGRTSTVWN